jgi:hypothetical protein
VVPNEAGSEVRKEQSERPVLSYHEMAMDSLEYRMIIENIGQHFVCKIGCQRFIGHDAAEVKAWLLDMFDKFTGYWIENVVKPQADGPKV